MKTYLPALVLVQLQIQQCALGNLFKALSVCPLAGAGGLVVNGEKMEGGEGRGITVCMSGR